MGTTGPPPRGPASLLGVTWPSELEYANAKPRSDGLLDATLPSFAVRRLVAQARGAELALVHVVDDDQL